MARSFLAIAVIWISLFWGILENITPQSESNSEFYRAGIVSASEDRSDILSSFRESPHALGDRSPSAIAPSVPPIKKFLPPHLNCWWGVRSTTNLKNWFLTNLFARTSSKIETGVKGKRTIQGIRSHKFPKTTKIYPRSKQWKFQRINFPAIVNRRSIPSPISADLVHIETYIWFDGLCFYLLWCSW